jgi:ketosteroid isomerase-like protein
VSKENVEVVREMVDAFNRGDFQTSLALLDDEVEWHDPPGVPGAGVHRGPEAVRSWLARWLGAWESYTVSVEEIIDAGDQVVVVHHERARGKESGVEVDNRSANVCDVRDGKVVRKRPYADRSQALAATELGSEESDD